LATLVAHAIAAEAADGTADLVALVDRVAAAGEPEEPLAAQFRSGVLAPITAEPVYAGAGADVAVLRPKRRSTSR
jgi:hypothetical protein